RGCGEQNRRTGKVAPDLEHVSGRRFYGLPQDCRFVEPLADQTAIATIASEDPGQIFEAFSPGMRRFFHPVDKSLSRHSAQPSFCRRGLEFPRARDFRDRKSTRLNSSHLGISYA